MFGFEVFLQNYGWLGFLAYVVIKEAWPFFRDKVWPRKAAQEDAQRASIRKLEEINVRIEERQAKVLESMSLSVQQMALAIATNNERLSQLINGHAEHARSMRQTPRKK